MSNLRRAALELAAVAVEELTQAVTAALREEEAPAFWRSHSERPYSDESQLPMPEEGDRLSGQYEPDGHTEQEWEDLQRERG